MNISSYFRVGLVFLLTFLWPVSANEEKKFQVQIGTYSKYDLETLTKFQRILDNEINFLGKQILALHLLKRMIVEALKSELNRDECPQRERVGQILSLARRGLDHLNTVILNVGSLMNVRREMKEFIRDQVNNANSWKDDIIKEYPLHIYLNEYLDAVSNTLQKLKSEIKNNYGKFIIYVSLALKVEHRSGKCDMTTGPLHRALLGAANKTIDIQRIIRGQVDET